ncbi:MAG: hypothetical protein NUV86_03470 [Candidatus Scalindua sp.]|nr:hypothetical protein [Candidatus Scalindua sp.]MCR4345352.1 hypothetical protein [Candidatus Scalindua sp.]
MGGEVDSIIRNCLEAKLCNKKMAGIIFDGLVFPYLDLEKFRRTFDYEIKFHKLNSDIKTSSVNFSKDSYFKVTEELTPNMTTYDNEKGIRIICKYTGAEISTKEKTEFKISVVSLHTKKQNYYTAYLYDPSHNPKIKLHYNDEMGDIFATIHFTTSEKKDIEPFSNDDAKHVLAEAKDLWVFPTSGVVFIWTPR